MMRRGALPRILESGSGLVAGTIETQVYLPRLRTVPGAEETKKTSIHLVRHTSGVAAPPEWDAPRRLWLPARLRLERAALELQSGKHGLPRAKIPRQRSAADTGITADSCPRPRKWKTSLSRPALRQAR